MRIPSKILKAILLASGKKDIRKYLNGVHINSRHIIATDGARLHAYSHGQEWSHGDVIIPRDAIEMALKAKILEIEITDVSVGAVSYKPVDGRYPEYMRVIPAVAQIAPPGLPVLDVNPAYTKDADEFIRSMQKKGDAATALSRVGGCWTWQTERAAVVVMPMLVIGSLEQFK